MALSVFSGTAGGRISVFTMELESRTRSASRLFVVVDLGPWVRVSAKYVSGSSFAVGFAGDVVFVVPADGDVSALDHANADVAAPAFLALLPYTCLTGISARSVLRRLSTFGRLKLST